MRKRMKKLTGGGKLTLKDLPLRDHQLLRWIKQRQHPDFFVRLCQFQLRKTFLDFEDIICSLERLESLGFIRRFSPLEYGEHGCIDYKTMDKTHSSEVEKIIGKWDESKYDYPPKIEVFYCD